MSDVQNNEAGDDIDAIVDAREAAASPVEEPATVEKVVENSPFSAPSAEEIAAAEAAKPAEEVEDGEKDGFEPRRTTPNVNEYFNVLTPDDRGTPDVISLPPDTAENVIENIQRTPNLDAVGTEKAKVWNAVMEDSLTYLPLGGMYTTRMGSPTASWSQVLEYGGDRLYGAAPGNRMKPGVNEAEGERAILRLVTQLGIGGLHRTPLFNSGFWVFFKPAAEAELLELNAALANDKVYLGRSSYGLAHTQHVAVALQRVFELALRHVYETSVKQSELPIANLHDYIAPQDIHAFIWGFLAANYPSGFHYERACSNDPTKCNHVERGNLAISKTLVVDTERLNDWQKNHMRSFSAGTMTLNDVKRYRDELTHMHARRVFINKGTEHEIALTLQTPTMREYLDQGYKYVSSLSDAVTRSLNVDVGNDQRNAAIDQRSRAEKLCQWSHFVKSMEFGQVSDESQLAATIIKDRDTVVKSLAVLSSTDSISEEIIKEITRYVEDSTISLMAIPAYDCPVCKEPQEKATEGRYPRMAAYIPLDVLQVFFGLLARRIRRITSR